METVLNPEQYAEMTRLIEHKVAHLSSEETTVKTMLYHNRVKKYLHMILSKQVTFEQLFNELPCDYDPDWAEIKSNRDLILGVKLQGPVKSKNYKCRKCDSYECTIEKKQMAANDESESLIVRCTLCKSSYTL
jgi:DNA-directed RNA polymerase subunit M/transcription elongation factor TFIIS